MKNEKGIAVIGVIGIIAVFGLFTAYVTGHPLPWGKEKVSTPPVAVIAVTPAQ